MQPPAPSARAHLARALTEKFGRGRYVVAGASAPELIEALQVLGVEAGAAGSGNGAHEDRPLAVWLYGGESEAQKAAIISQLAAADDVLLLAASAGTLSPDRKALIEEFRRHGFRPDYESELVTLDLEGVRLVRAEMPDAAEVIGAAEQAFARLNNQVRSLQRTLRTRMSELEAADRHIANLEQKLLKLKEYRRSIKQLKDEKHALRKSPERKVGQVLLAPYRLPEKLYREIRKRWPAEKSTPQTEYARWFERHRVTAEQAVMMREQIRDFAIRPWFSIVTPVFNTPVQWLDEAVESVRSQVYGKWELILVDDHSTDPATLELLRELPTRDERIIVQTLAQRGGISAASNRGLEVARGDWIGFLDHDDVLEPDALFQHVKLIQQHPDADLVYSDEDKLTESGLDAPIMKPDWSPDFFTACNYICHFTVIRAALLADIGGFRSQFDGAQDYDLFFRVAERTTRIFHVPRVLYHWRRSEASTADNIRRKPQSLETGRLAVESHLRRCGKEGHVTVDWRNHGYRVRRDITHPKKISIIIPVRDRIDLLRRCIDSIHARTAYDAYEIVVVDNDSASDEARDYFAKFKHRLLRYSGPFNYSAINNFAVQQTDSPWLLFLNNDTEAIEPGWLAAMVEHVQQPEVGAVGPRLLYPDDTVQHAGIVVGVGGIAEHAFRGFPAEAPGVCRQLQVMRNYSAVTGACLLTRREVFDEVGGFDEERLPVTFNDVDLCLKMRKAGYLIVYTPYAMLYHHEGASRRRTVEPIETEVMRERWADVLENDPYYNPNLSRERADFSLRN